MRCEVLFFDYVRYLFLVSKRYLFLIGMGRKKFTRMIKARVDDETYRKARELADMMTNGKLAELIRQLIKVAYGVEKNEYDGSSNCSELPLFLEVMAPALESGSTLQYNLFSTVDEWGFRNRDVINMYVWDGCCRVMFYIENVEGKDHVVARAVVKRDKANILIDIVKDALASIGVDMNKLRVRTYDPCKCQW
jgi:hypothetical protein